MEFIARIRSEFKEKFGIPRQSGLVPQTRGVIVFEPPYRCQDALRGIEGFSHLWLLWSFSQCNETGWSPTVRPPRLGGNTRMGVFATRSPFRPNGIGLSCVTLEAVHLHTEEGPVLVVGGADLMDGTPIYDIKPYLPFVDSHPEATGGFAGPAREHALRVEFPETLLQAVPERAREALKALLAQDPRPSYQHDPERLYGLPFAGVDVRFTVDGDTLTVRAVEKYRPEQDASEAE